MTTTLFIAVCASVVCFLFGCVRRIRQYSTLPVHVRWELYPVPHEAPERAAHGGSYFEQSEWWTQPRRFHLAGELKVMLAEIFLLKSVWDSNRKLWWRSLLFHLGIFCVVACTVVEVALFLGTMTGISGILPLDRASVVVGRAGLAMIVVGGSALLWRRITDSNLTDYTNVADYGHLAAMSFASALVLAGTLDVAAPSPQLFLNALFGFHSVHVPSLLAIGLVLMFAILAYVPYSKMSHFIAKYFTYHTVRWDDAPNNADLQARISTYLALRPTWSAEHIAGDGRKTWIDIVSHNPAASRQVQR